MDSSTLAFRPVEQGLSKCLPGLKPEAVAAEVDRASLLGHGGAGFPGGAQVVDAPPRPHDLPRRQRQPRRAGDVQGPPAHRARDPHQIIEGATIAAYAVGTRLAFIYCPRGVRPRARAPLTAACNEAYEHGALGGQIFGSTFSLDVVVHPGAGAYICGEETAPHREPEGGRDFPAHQAAELPRHDRPLRGADGRDVAGKRNLPVGSVAPPKFHL